MPAGSHVGAPGFQFRREPLVLKNELTVHAAIAAFDADKLDETFAADGAHSACAQQPTRSMP
jgi:hypothetical protein